jgi:hypothetical protein
VPDTELPLAEIPWLPLSEPPLKEHYGVLKPIPTFEIPEEMPHHHGHHHHAE